MCLKVHYNLSEYWPCQEFSLVDLMNNDWNCSYYVVKLTENSSFTILILNISKLRLIAFDKLVEINWFLYYLVIRFRFLL